MNLDRSELEHPSFLTAVGTVLSYSLVLIAMFLVLFAVPYLVFLSI